MIHSTGAENPNLRRYVQPDDGTLGVNPNGNDWNRPGLDVAVHAFIGLTRSGRGGGLSDPPVGVPGLALWRQWKRHPSFP